MVEDNGDYRYLYSRAADIGLYWVFVAFRLFFSVTFESANSSSVLGQSSRYGISPHCFDGLETEEAGLPF